MSCICRILYKYVYMISSMNNTTNTINASDIIEGGTYIVTNYVIDEPRKKMQVTIRKSTAEYVTAETKVVFNKIAHISLATWPASLVAQWTFAEVSN